MGKKKERAASDDMTQAQMAKIVSESSQLADYYRQVAAKLTLAMHRALYFLNSAEPTEGDRLMAKNALMSIFGYEEPKEWKSHWFYNHARPSHQAVLDVVNNTLMRSAAKGQLAEMAGLPDLFYRYLYEAVCFVDGREPSEDTPEELKYMGVTYKPMSAMANLLEVNDGQAA